MCTEKVEEQPCWNSSSRRARVQAMREKFDGGRHWSVPLSELLSIAEREGVAPVTVDQRRTQQRRLDHIKLSRASRQHEVQELDRGPIKSNSADRIVRLPRLNVQLAGSIDVRDHPDPLTGATKEQSLSLCSICCVLLLLFATETSVLVW